MHAGARRAVCWFAAANVGTASAAIRLAIAIGISFMSVPTFRSGVEVSPGSTATPTLTIPGTWALPSRSAGGRGHVDLAARERLDPRQRLLVGAEVERLVQEAGDEAHV